MARDRETQQPPYCIVTGGNSGIGLEIAAGCMEAGMDVVLACRDLTKCEAARAELQGRGSTGSCECSRLDLEDAASIRAFAHQQGQRLERSPGRPLVLVNNAGVIGGSASVSSSHRLHSDQHMAVNHLGPFLLTGLLLPHMRPSSRIINVASRAHAFGRLQFEEGGAISAGPPSWFLQYSRSKLANILHVSALQTRLQARGIVATAVSPGFVSTGIFRSVATWSSPISCLAAALARHVGRTPAQGAACAVFAATSPSLSPDGPVPLLLHDNKPLVASAQARDRQLARDLWAASERAVGWAADSCGAGADGTAK